MDILDENLIKGQKIDLENKIEALKTYTYH